MENKNKVDKLIESLDQSRRAMPSADFLLKMENISLRYTAIVDKVSINTIMGVAASFTLLLMVNMMILKKSNDSTLERSKIEITESSYDLIPTKSLYNE